MIGIRKDTEYLDMYPGTSIQRDRTSPFFMSKTSNGKDGIPGEVSYPFKLPPSDKNYRLLDFPHVLPQFKTKTHDCVLEDNGQQLSNGKLVLDVIQSNLQQNNVGYIDSHLLSNSSEFFKRIENKKLWELDLGGPRAFQWNGYSRTAAGFWKYIHDTWDYNSCDDGDFVFYPIFNTSYLGGTTEFQNEITWSSSLNNIELNRDKIITALTPAIYYKLILTSIFTEHQYTVSGDLLNDEDFKKATMPSYRGVYWSEIRYDADSPEVLIPTPRSNITIKLSEHMPPTWTIAEFMVELQKMLPIAFLINDNTRHCEIIWLNKISTSGAKDRTGQFSPNHSMNLGEGLGINKVYGFKRPIDGADTYPSVCANLNTITFAGDTIFLPGVSNTPGKCYRVNSLNEYWYERGSTSGTSWEKLGSNICDYAPSGVTDYLDNRITPLPIIYTRNYYTGTSSRPAQGRVPRSEVEGTWFSKEGDAVEWGMRIMFYRGRTLNIDNDLFGPHATDNVYIFTNLANPGFPNQLEGNWCLSFENGPYGLQRLWDPWLKLLGNNETLSGTLIMPLYEYLQLRWDEVLLIQSTPYVIQKIKETLPYPGKFEFEAVRKL